MQMTLILHTGSMFFIQGLSPKQFVFGGKFQKNCNSFRHSVSHWLHILIGNVEVDALALLCSVGGGSDAVAAAKGMGGRAHAPAAGLVLAQICMY